MLKVLCGNRDDRDRHFVSNTSWEASKSCLAGVLGHCHFCSGGLGVPTNARVVLYHWQVHSGPVLKRGQWLVELVFTGGQLAQMVSA